MAEDSTPSVPVERGDFDKEPVEDAFEGRSWDWSGHAAANGSAWNVGDSFDAGRTDVRPGQLAAPFPLCALTNFTRLQTLSLVRNGLVGPLDDGSLGVALVSSLTALDAPRPAEQPAGGLDAAFAREATTRLRLAHKDFGGPLPPAATSSPARRTSRARCTAWAPNDETGKLSAEKMRQRNIGKVISQFMANQIQKIMQELQEEEDYEKAAVAAMDTGISRVMHIIRDVVQSLKIDCEAVNHGVHCVHRN
eukprot:gene1810-1313_t